MNNLDNCLLRNCPHCKHETVHSTQDKVLDGTCYQGYSRGSFPQGKKGDSDYEGCVSKLRERMDELQKASTVPTHICTVCGKRWVDCSTKELWGDYVHDERRSVLEDVSEFCNKIKLK